MASFTLEYTTCKEIRAYPVLVSVMEDLTEQRRKTSDKDIIGWQFTSDVLRESEMQAYQTFYNNQTGPLTAFTWTNPNNGTTYNVRFDGPLSTDYEGGVWKVSWSFKAISEA